MNLEEKLNLDKNNLFQFYIITGNTEKNLKITKNFLKNNFNILILNEWKENELLIEKARELKKENSFSVNQNEKKIFLLSFKKISIESQNALLKTFEETGQNFHIFLFVESENFLLKTVKSRAKILKGEEKYNLNLAKKFYQSNFKEREKIISKLEKEEIIIFLNSLEKFLLEEKKINNKMFYKNFLDLKQYSFDKGVSLKNILNWIAINL